jgi:phosphoserine phosphatase
MSKTVLINISGRDRKGLVSKFTAILAEYNTNVLDIGQAVIHEHISLGILVEIPNKDDFSAIFKDLLFEGHQLGVAIDVKPVDVASYEHGGLLLFLARKSRPVRFQAWRRWWRKMT